jgi:hypothetical protein
LYARVMVGLQPESVAGAAIEPTLAAPMALPLAMRCRGDFDA